MSEIRIRAEGPQDREAVFDINAAAFPTEVEARLVDHMRDLGGPVVSLVAEDDGGVQGHALLTAVSVGAAGGDGALMALGPMAVRPESQRRGVGGALVKASLDACRERGAAAVFVLGHADYYPRFGFEPAAPHGLFFRDRQFDPHFFVAPLKDGALDGLQGEVVYAPGFDEA